MNKLYDRIYWHNNTTPALNESNLNSMSKAIDNIDDRVIQLADDVVDDIANIHQWRDECAQYKIQASVSASNALAFANSAGDYASDAEDYADNSEAWANGTRSGYPINPTDPAWHKNSKYYSEVARTLIETAEAWAVGERAGEPVPSTDPAYNNNSKYYAEQAGDIKDDCEDIKEEIIDVIGAPTFTINFMTGELEYTANINYTFSINMITGNLEWEVVA